MNNWSVRHIEYKFVIPWLLKKHYAARIPSVQFCMALYEYNNMVGVVTYGTPASWALCVGVCGREYKDFVIELNRLCLMDNKKNQASFLIGRSLKMLPKPRIVVSYADTAMHHCGYIYQATNWIYTGKTKKMFDMVSDDGNKHSRHNKGGIKRERSIKHRYVYFVGDKRQKRELNKNLKYPVLSYPKETNQKYDTSENFPTQKLLF